MQDLRQIELALGCSGLLIEVRPEWGSNQDSQHRYQIRSGLARAIANQTDPVSFENRISVDSSHAILELPQPDWTTALEILPQSRSHFCSITHSRSQGGFAICRRTSNFVGLGFDIETLSRLTPGVINRVSQPSEAIIAPDSRFLWSAKEAVFKGTPALRQPVAITEISICDWSTELNEIYTFKATLDGHNLGRGVVKLDPRNDEVFAFFATDA